MTTTDLVDRICELLEQAYDEGLGRTDAFVALIGVAISEAMIANVAEDTFVDAVRHSFKKVKMVLSARERGAGRKETSS